MYRPAPLVRAYCLEEKLQTPAKIYYKFEGNNTSGSHKLNSAIAQAYYAKQQGLKGVTTETGAGQWGTALSMACSYSAIAFAVRSQSPVIITTLEIPTDFNRSTISADSSLNGSSIRIAAASSLSIAR